MATEEHQVEDYDSKVVHFRRLENPNEDIFSLELPFLMASGANKFCYEDITRRVASRLEMGDHTKIRLTSSNLTHRLPQCKPISYEGCMYENCSQTFDIMYYEVLDTPLPEQQTPSWYTRCGMGLITLNVAFHHASGKNVLFRSITLEQHDTVGDLISNLKTKVGLSSPKAKLRLLLTANGRICKIYPLCRRIEDIKVGDYFDTSTLRAEEIPEEEKNLDPLDTTDSLDYFIEVRRDRENASLTLTDEVSRYLSWQPFLLRIKEGGTFAEVKVRIQKKLSISNAEFSKYKIRLLPFGSDPYTSRKMESSVGYLLQDSDIVSSRLRKTEAMREVADMSHFLFVEFSDHDSSPERADVFNKKRLKTVQIEATKGAPNLVNFSPSPYYSNTGKLHKEGHGSVHDSKKFEDFGGFSILEKQAQSYERIWWTLGRMSSSRVTAPLNYLGAGQLYKEGHGSILDPEKFNDIGGFSILKPQAALYNRIWLKYCHIASSRVLTAQLFSAEVAAVTNIMNSVMDMYQRCVDVSPLLIELWEEKIRDAERFGLSIRWLRGHIEPVKNYFREEFKFMTFISEKKKFTYAAEWHVDSASYGLKNLKNELRKTRVEVNLEDGLQNPHVEVNSEDGLQKASAKVKNAENKLASIKAEISRMSKMLEILNREKGNCTVLNGLL